MGVEKSLKDNPGFKHVFRSGTVWLIRDFARHNDIGGLFVASPAFFRVPPK
jgi:hypothetical protein